MLKYSPRDLLWRSIERNPFVYMSTSYPCWIQRPTSLLNPSEYFLVTSLFPGKYPGVQGFIRVLAKHQHAAAVQGTAQPPAQQREIEVVSLPLQVFINSLLIWSINSWTSGKTELFNPKILKANIFLFKSTSGICGLLKVTFTADLKYPLFAQDQSIV